ncbi:MAG: hypothetical protein JRH20_18955 [Deltaproteobacteria bacterium]|nr:hypothetical protein [Deltaproteobacteria bacterium]
MHFSPNSKRYSNDLDYFHDSVERVAQAYAADHGQLVVNGYDVKVEMHQPGFVRAIISKAGHITKIEWAHDSAWRFMPPIYNATTGYQLHPIDVATNKVLALAGRNEARDLLDVLDIHGEMLPLGALCWAAVGKDPGFTPLSLLELLKRRGKFRASDFAKLQTVESVDVVALKGVWLEALEDAESFMEHMPPDDVGCLYYSPRSKLFVEPTLRDGVFVDELVCHFGAPGGVLPQLYNGDVLATTWKAEPAPKMTGQ